MSYKTDYYTPIQKSSFTSVGTGLTLTDTIHGVNLVKANNGGATDNISGMYIAAPGTPYTITACLTMNGDFVAKTGYGNGTLTGIGWSDGTKYITFGFFTAAGSPDGTVYIAVTKYTNSTTYSASYVLVSAQLIVGNDMWFRIADNGTNRICSYSKNGVDFYQVHSVGRTDFLTATRVGVWTDPIGSDTNLTVQSWKAT